MNEIDRKAPHFVDSAPFRPDFEEPADPKRERFYRASQWQIIWWKFRRHRVAVWAAAVLAIFYLCVPFAEIIAPYPANMRSNEHLYAPPQPVHFFHEGRFVGPFVYDLEAHVDLETMSWRYTENREEVEPIRFFCSGPEYEFWGLFAADFHLACPSENGTLYFLGTDRLGRDLFSGIVYGARVSLTVGLIGVAISMALGIFFGGLAGYLGGVIDSMVNRLIEVLRCIPELPLWMALSAALPVTWGPLRIYFGLTIILGLLDWPGLARAVRAKLLSLREEDYARAAKVMGAGPTRIITRHLLPGFTSHLVASATLAIPSMILGETALSFLDLGLRRPAVSWGVLLNEAQNISIVTVYPWLMAPVIPVVLVVLAFNFVGDGLRDAADPYKH